MSAPYRPSNGTEGEGFMWAWCGRCVHDQATRDDPDGFDGCPIIANTMAYRIDDPEYPKAWVTDDSGPRCTEFSAVDPGVQPVPDLLIPIPLTRGQLGRRLLGSPPAFGEFDDPTR